MKENKILQIEIDINCKSVLALEPVRNGERTAWVTSWLEDEISTDQLLERMNQRFQWVKYLSLSDFLISVEMWLKKKSKVANYA